jgi:hypothetical protein
MVSLLGFDMVSLLGFDMVSLLWNAVYGFLCLILGAALTRAARVNERKVDALIKLYPHFEKAQEYLQLMVDNTHDTLFRYSHDRFRQAYESAGDTFSHARFFLPPNFILRCDSFLKSLRQGQVKLIQVREAVDPERRIDLLEEAQRIAFEDIPTILEQIEKDARSLVAATPIDSLRRFVTRYDPQP